MRIERILTALMLVALIAMASPAIAQEDEPTLAEPVAVAEAAPRELATVRPLAVTVHLTGGVKLEGTLVSSTQLEMKTSFGEMNVPLSEVAGIRMASEGNATTTVVMHNGDSITGGTEMEMLEIQTEWGRAEVNGVSIDSILFAPGLVWTSENGVAGTRWMLKEGPGVQTTTAQASHSQPTAPQATRTVPAASRPQVVPTRYYYRSPR